MLYAVLSSKGGVGKTTVSVHLGAALARARGARRVVLLDGDAHTSATRWYQRGDGQLPFVVRPLTADTSDADHVVIDSAANEAPADLLDLARAADRVIVPTPPSALDLVAALDTLRLLEAARPLVLLTRCPPAPQLDALEARELLRDSGAHVLRIEIPNRKAYQAAALDGVTVREVRDRAAPFLWAAWPRLLREVNA
jgi:chromosome partitioning protein